MFLEKSGVEVEGRRSSSSSERSKRKERVVKEKVGSFHWRKGEGDEADVYVVCWTLY